MIEIAITPEMLMVAQKNAEAMGVLKKSFMKGAGNLAGFLGEEMVKSYLGCESDNTYQYDMIYNGYTIDVKTKNCTSPPKYYYECSIAEYTLSHQNPDYYIFNRVMINDSVQRGWILGFLSKSQYMERSAHHTKGELDPSNNFTFVESCYNVTIDHLLNINGFTELCKKN